MVGTVVASEVISEEVSEAVHMDRIVVVASVVVAQVLPVVVMVVADMGMVVTEVVAAIGDPQGYVVVDTKGDIRSVGK